MVTMMTYSQGSGLFTFADGSMAHGYSGNGQWKNDPHSQDVKGHGPLPRGLYTIGEAIVHPHLGSVAMPLSPHPDNDMFGRGSFYIHGDSVAHPGAASEGCIILPHDVRLRISQGEDRTLKVVE